MGRPAELHCEENPNDPAYPQIIQCLKTNQRNGTNSGATSFVP